MEISYLLVCFLCFVAAFLFSFSTDQPYRTGFHFQPPKNWMNDPNGPIYYKGVYHLFYQYNPYAAIWGNITWAHSVSFDLINWIHLTHALSPTDPFDINGCWSGSATLLSDGKPMIIYTGGDSSNRQVQNLAIPKNSSDPFLREWVKFSGNPIISPIDPIDPQNFRDPTTAWKGRDGIWRVLVASKMERSGFGAALLYRSSDFVSWKRSNHPFDFSSKTQMWECPDFYPIGENGSTKYVLKASFDDQDHYILGNYDSETDKFKPDINFLEGGLDLKHDYGNFYASKTFFDDSTSRRILWGWIRESDSNPDDVKKGWAGIQSFPRNIILDKTSQRLIQTPIRELEKLRGDSVSFQNKELDGGLLMEVSGITATQADVEVHFEVQNLEEAEKLEPEQVDALVLCGANTTEQNRKIGPFGLLVLASEDLRERTAVFFRVYKIQDKYAVLMCSDQTRSSLKEDVQKPIYGAFLDIDLGSEKISLRTLIDRSIVESFGGGGKICMTARAYPETAIEKKAKIYVFNNGSVGVSVSSLHAWSIKNAHFTSN